MTDQSKKFTLHRTERLKSRTIISRLFDEGQSIFVFPLKLIYLPLSTVQQGSGEILFGVTIPKRIHRKANVRNLLKRRIRESYRLHKPWIQNNTSIAIMYVLVDKNISEYAVIEESMIKINRKLASILNP